HWNTFAGTALCSNLGGTLVYEWADDQTFTVADRLVSTVDPTEPASEGFISLRTSPRLVSSSTDNVKRLSRTLQQSFQQEPVLDGFHHIGEAILQEMFSQYPA